MNKGLPAALLDESVISADEYLGLTLENFENIRNLIEAFKGFCVGQMEENKGEEQVKNDIKPEISGNFKKQSEAYSTIERSYAQSFGQDIRYTDSSEIKDEEPIKIPGQSHELQGNLVFSHAVKPEEKIGSSEEKSISKAGENYSIQMEEVKRKHEERFAKSKNETIEKPSLVPQVNLDSQNNKSKEPELNNFSEEKKIQINVRSQVLKNEGLASESSPNNMSTILNPSSGTSIASNLPLASFHYNQNPNSISRERLPRANYIRNRENHFRDEMTYEQLTELDAHQYDVGNGFDNEILANLNQSSYQKNPHEIVLCNVCQEALKEGDVVSYLRCTHLFHYGCIYNWLSRKKKCPFNCELNEEDFND